MITADKLTLLTNFPTHMITTLIQSAGYTQDKFISSKFVGITDGGDFCYSVTFKDNMEDGELTSKVFVKYNAQQDSVSAEY